MTTKSLMMRSSLAGNRERASRLRRKLGARASAMRVSNGAVTVLLEACTFLLSLAVIFLLLTAVYMLLLSIMVAVALSRLSVVHNSTVVSERVYFAFPWVISRRRGAVIGSDARDAAIRVQARSLEATCPVRDHTTSDVRCAVCLEDMTRGDATRTLPCMHTYHAKCVELWLHKGANRCPLCNAKILALFPSVPPAPEPPAAVAAAATAASVATAAAAAAVTAPQQVAGEPSQGPPVRRRFWNRFRRRRV